ncbi:MAG: 30S ribosomal protein S20 [Verrucomicrobiae bacterium]|nr:30S ribosomal protein S20 [Verrucomicrobiae bacterium]
MPNTASAAKQARAGIRRRLRNNLAKTQLRSILKKFLATVKSGKKDDATALYPKVVSVLDRAVKNGRVHRNAAARSKSRLNKRLKAMA